MADSVRGLLSSPRVRDLQVQVKEDDEDEGDGSLTMDTVQFSSPFYFADEETDNSFVIDIFRIGKRIGPVTVTFETAESSAKEFEHFIPLKQEVQFADGESQKSVTIQLLDKDGWESTLEMHLLLSKARGCVLGPFLRSARLKIIDSDHFPSDNVEEYLAAGAATISRTKLLWEYFKLVFHQRGMKSRTIAQVLLDQLSNAYLYYTIRLEVYLVNELLVSDDPYLILDTKRDTVALVSVMFFLPMVVIQIAEEIQTQMNIHSRVEIYLQKALFRKYLNYTEASRMKVPVSKLQSAISGKSALLASAYIGVLDLITTLVRVVMLLYFIHCRHTGALKLILVMPVVLTLFGYFRLPYLLDFMRGKTHGKLNRFVAETCTCYDLVKSFQQRPHMGDLFAKIANKMSENTIEVNKIATHNFLFTRWLSPVFVAVYVYVYADMCIEGEVKLGVFLAIFGIIKGMSSSFVTIFQSIVGIYVAANPLAAITDLLNMETEVRQSKDTYDRRSKMTISKRAELIGKERSGSGQEDGPALDRLEIEFNNVDFEYKPGIPIISGVSLKIKQGSLVGILGEPGSGRGTFMHLLAQTIFPSRGHLFVPLHIFALYVSQNPLLFSTSAWFNLTFGSLRTPTFDRVKAVLEKLGAQPIVDLISKAENRPAAEDDGPHHASWLGSLSYTVRMKVHLARAFIMNPQLMILCRPFDIFYREDEQLILRALHEHISNCGLSSASSDGPKSIKRPRTVVMTLENPAEAESFDYTLLVKDRTVSILSERPRRSMVT